MANGFVSEIYPNPASQSVSINYQLPSEVNQASVRIINLLGEVVNEANIELGTSKKQLDISNLSGGVYFYSVMINGEIYKTKKIVVQN